MSVRDWLEPMLRDWGAQRRRIMAGKLVRRDGSVHEDGWPSTSITDSARAGGITGGSGPKQHFPEVYTGDALLIWRAMALLEGSEAKEIIHLHFVIVGLHVKQKASAMGLSLPKYFQRLRVVEELLAHKIEAIDVPPPQSTTTFSR